MRAAGARVFFFLYKNVRGKRTKRSKSPVTRAIWQGCQISPLFHEDDQDDQVNSFDHLAPRPAFFWLRERAGLETERFGNHRRDGCGVFPKLSRPLGQENALSAPCARRDFCSPQAEVWFSLRENHEKAARFGSHQL